MLILQSFSPASPCFVYLTKCHAIPNHKTNSCNFFNLLPKMMSSTPAACLWSFSYSRSRTIPYQEPQLLSVILSSMPLPSSLASLLGTKLVYCPFYLLHKTKLILEFKSFQNILMAPSMLKIVSESTNKRFRTGVETSCEKCFKITPNNPSLIYNT